MEVLCCVRYCLIRKVKLFTVNTYNEAKRCCKKKDVPDSQSDKGEKSAQMHSVFVAMM